MTWQGRLTLLAACTPIIDSYSSHADALGPRWLYCRVDAQDAATKRATGRKALGAGMLAQHRSRAAILAAGIVRDALARVPATLDDATVEQILDAAIVACYGRAAVERDGYGRREISSMAMVEEPPRLTGQLALLARALLGLGMGADEVVALCRRCALDSIPQARRRALATLARFDATVSEVARDADCHRNVARMALEELEAIGVATCDDPGNAQPGAPRPWTLTAPNDQLIRRVMLDHARSGGVTRKVGTTPPSPPSKTMPSYFSCQGPDPDSDTDDGARDLSVDELDALEEARAVDLLSAAFPDADVQRPEPPARPVGVGL